MIFIDARNVIHAAAQYYGDDDVGKYEEGEEKPKIDFPRLVEWVSGQNVKDIRFYDSYPPDKKYDDWYDFLRKQTFNVNTKPCRYRDGEMISKGIDIWIGTDMVAMAHRDEYDEAVLLTADSDFVEAVNHVQDEDKRVVASQFEFMIEDRLRSVVDNFIPIDRKADKLEKTL